MLIYPCTYVYVFTLIVRVRTKQCYITQCSQLMLALTLTISPWLCNVSQIYLLYMRWDALIEAFMSDCFVLIA